jgi:3-oxoacyl-[acyl-carrier protein] reductase
MSSTSTTRRGALVTGGSRGIGRAAALRLADAEYAVAIVYANNTEEADDVIAAISDTGGQAAATKLDVGEEAAVAAALDQVEETFGGIDVVVNAAGIMPLAPIIDLDLGVLDRIYRTNIRGTFAVSQQAARRVRTGGAIVNFSSTLPACHPRLRRIRGQQGRG